jgi:hypothetical protein
MRHSGCPLQPRIFAASRFNAPMLQLQTLIPRKFSPDFRDFRAAGAI